MTESWQAVSKREETPNNKYRKNNGKREGWGIRGTNVTKKKGFKTWEGSGGKRK